MRRAKESMENASPPELPSSEDSPTLQLIASRFADLRIRKEDLEEQLKRVQENLDTAEENLVQWMETAGLDQFRTVDGHGCTLRVSIHPSVKDKDALMTWVKKNKLTSMLSVHPSTLKSLCKERLEEGQGLPDGVESFNQTRVTFRRNRNAG